MSARVVVSAKVKPAVLARIDASAREKGVTRSDELRRVIADAYGDDEEEEQQ